MTTLPNGLAGAEIRPPAVAGRFYPGEAQALAGMVDDLLAQVGTHGLAPKALIVPHAGYRYSGIMAAQGYATLLPRSHRIRRAVLLGPNHTAPLRGFAVSSHAGYATPLGVVPVDVETRDALLREGRVQLSDELHAGEHCLEVQLPFLQRLFTDIAVLPILIGQVAPEETASLIAHLWSDEETVILISSDLSHFLSYDEACALDAEAVAAIERLDPAGLAPEQACGRHAIRGLLTHARSCGLRATTVGLCNSGDTAGDKSRVVGYTSVAFEPLEKARLGKAQRHELLRSAARSLRHAVRQGEGKAPEVEVSGFTASLRSQRASFVTLSRENGRLRGCIGSLKPHQPLIRDVVENSVKAGFEDPRFKPLATDELPGLTMGISILSHPVRMHFSDEADALAQLEPREDGVILATPEARGTFLPHVWEGLGDREDFMKALKHKAGLAEDFWSDEVQLYRFRTESFASSVAPLLQDSH